MGEGGDAAVLRASRPEKSRLNLRAGVVSVIVCQAPLNPYLWHKCDSPARQRFPRHGYGGDQCDAMSEQDRSLADICVAEESEADIQLFRWWLR